MSSEAFREFVRATGPMYTVAPGKQGPDPECAACEGTGWIPRCDDDGREFFVRCPCMPPWALKEEIP